MRTSRQVSGYGVVYVLLILILAACSASRPPVSASKDALVARISSESGGVIKLLGYSKTDGFDVTDNGIRSYVEEFTATVEFTKACRWNDNPSLESLKFAVGPVAQQAGGATMALLQNVADPGRNVAPGQQVSVTGVIRFIKGDSGWRVLNSTVSNAQPVGAWLAVAAPPAAQIPNQRTAPVTTSREADAALDAAWAQLANVLKREWDLGELLLRIAAAEPTIDPKLRTAVSESLASVRTLNLAVTPMAKAMEEIQLRENYYEHSLAELSRAVKNNPTLGSQASVRDVAVQLEGTENRISTETDRFASAVSENSLKNGFSSTYVAFSHGSRPHTAEEFKRETRTGKLSEEQVVKIRGNLLQILQASQQYYMERAEDSVQYDQLVTLGYFHPAPPVPVAGENYKKLQLNMNVERLTVVTESGDTIGFPGL